MKRFLIIWLFFLPGINYGMEESNERAVNFEQFLYLWKEQKALIQEAIDTTNKTEKDELIEHPVYEDTKIFLKPKDQMAIVSNKHMQVCIAYTFLLNSLDDTITEETCLLQQKKHIQSKRRFCSIQ